STSELCTRRGETAICDHDLESSTICAPFGYARRGWMNPGVAMSAAQADQPPKNVILFSGHMIDAPGRKTPRFPPEKERLAADAIAGMLAEIAVTEGDL